MYIRIVALRRKLFYLAVTFMIVQEAAQATEYKFRVDCAGQVNVISWITGDLDPGREYLKVVTGTQNPNCTTADFNDQLDGHLTIIDSREGAAAIVGGIPFLGGIIADFFW
jgi:hypothetical protein